jgi:tripartite-type tricarboxylate transporter receptor subunit TctC
VAKSNPDGYTLLYDASAFSINPSLYSNLSFDYAKDFEPVFLAALVPNILVVTPSVPVTSVADIVAMGKNTPRGLNFASSGFGTVQHLSLEMFRLASNTKINHVPYAGGGPALKAVSAGRVKFFFSNAASSIPLVQSGRLKAVAHTGNGRLATLPELPSVKESFAGFEAYDWNGVFVPAGTPQSVVERLSTSLDAAARDPQVIAQLRALNVETRNNSPSEFRTFVEAERLKWGRLVREANIKQR